MYEMNKDNNKNIISIIDNYNNSIIFNSSLLITINNDIIIDYLNDNDWNEIYHDHELYDNDNNIRNRRRLWGIFKKGFKRLRSWIRRLFGKVAVPPPKNSPFWHKKWIKKSRFIGYFPGYSNQKGLTYKKSEKYCDENYGGLATILSKKENIEVFTICKQLLIKYKKKRRCKRKCKYILFRGTKCWTHCYIPKIEGLYTKKHWKGHNCWIGLQLGSITNNKPFSKWNDMRSVKYKNWSPGEPNFRKKKMCKKLWAGNNEKQCEVKKIYQEKCGEILAYKAGKIRVKRSRKEKKLFHGVPANIQQQLAPKGQNIFKLVPRAGKWNNARCRLSRIPICQKPRGQVYDKYIAVRAARTYSVAQQFCNDWYGSTVATIENDKDNVMAMEACQAIDIDKRSCWIGLQRPFKHFDDGIKTKSFTNWAPREPNNAGYNENCVELYSGNGKWNDLGCNAKRYFLCNAKTKLQRMNTKLREKMIKKRLLKHQDIWKRHRKAEKRKKIRKQYTQNVMKYMQKQQLFKKEMMRKRREAIKQNIFNKQYGGFINKLGVHFRRRLFHNQQQQKIINKIHDNNKNKIIPKKKILELDMNMDEQEMMDTFGVGRVNNDDDDDINIKCTFFSNMYGLFQICIDKNGIEIKKYLKMEIKNNTNSSIVWNNYYDDDNESYLNYMEYEDFKYKIAMKYDHYNNNNNNNNNNEEEDEYGEIDEIKSDIMDNDNIDNYHLELTRFQYDLDNNHNKQCWKYLYEFELCLESEDNDNDNDNDNNMMMQLIKSNKNIFPSKSVQFFDDTEWDEITRIYRENHEMNIMIITKCIHIFEAKICIEYISEINNNSTSIPLSYRVNVLIHHDELSQESTD